MTLHFMLAPEEGRIGTLTSDYCAVNLPNVVLGPSTLNLLTLGDIAHAGMIVSLDTFSLWQAHQDLTSKRVKRNKLPNLKALTKPQGFIITTDPMRDAAGFAKSRGIKHDIVRFRTGPNGPLQSITPKLALELQSELGADMISLPSETIDYFAPKDLIDVAGKRTAEWTKATIHGLRNQLSFTAWQGAGLKRSRKEALQELMELGPLSGIAIDGIFQGEPLRESQRLLPELTKMLDESLPKALRLTVNPTGWLGLQIALQAGVDLVTTSLPTDLAEKGLVFDGKKNKKIDDFADKPTAIDEKCQCPVCRRYSAGAIADMFKMHQVVGKRLLAIHNLYRLQSLVPRLHSLSNEL